MKCTWPTRIKPLRTQREPYSTGSRWVCQASRWVCQASRWVRQGFLIPTCFKLSHSCDYCVRSLPTGESDAGASMRHVGFPNPRTQGEQFRVAVEYRLKIVEGMVGGGRACYGHGQPLFCSLWSLGSNKKEVGGALVFSDPCSPLQFLWI